MRLVEEVARQLAEEAVPQMTIAAGIEHETQHFMLEIQGQSSADTTGFVVDEVS